MKQAWKTFKRVLPYLRTYWKLAVYSLIFTFLSAGISLLLPWPLALTFDSVLGDEPLPDALAFLGSIDRITLLVLLALAGLALVAGQGVIHVVGEYVNTKLDQRIVLDFRSDLFWHAQRLSLAHHDQNRMGMFSAQINLQAAGAGAIVVAIPPILEALTTLVGMLVIAFFIDVKLTLVSLSVVPFVYYTTGYYAKRIEPQLVKVRGMEGESLAIVHEAMAMLRVIIPFGREPYEYGRFREQGERAVDARVDLTVRQTLFSTMVNVITGVGSALVLGYGAYRILQGNLSGGDLLVMITYVAKVYAPLQQLSTTFTSLQEQFVNLRGALQILDVKPEVEDAPDAREIGRASGRVSFEGVDFSYKGRVDTLKDISFEAQAGERVAIVGPTGAGKTTLVSLLTRFYDPSRGRILLDGIDTRNLQLKSLRAQISTVLQDPLLFSGTIADNIRYGRLEASMEDIVEAAKAANSHDFITQLPNGYDTKLGEGGRQLSGGERQRISIARAFLKNAPILILDEPTSSIDSRTEAVILDSLERLMEGRTTFMIAHRLSTVRNADLILVMDHGRLVEQGTHDELLKRGGGLYQQLYIAQTGQTQQKDRLEHFERLEQFVQGESVTVEQAADKAHRNGGRQPDPATTEANAQVPPSAHSSGGDEAFLTATPNPVLVGDGPGTTTIRWSVGDVDSKGQVYVSVNGGPEKLFAGGAKGSQEASWINTGAAYEFRLYAGTERHTLLATVTVTRGTVTRETVTRGSDSDPAPGARTSKREMERSAVPMSGTLVEPSEDGTAPPLGERRLSRVSSKGNLSRASRKLSLIIRRWIWDILTVASIVTGMMVGVSLVVVPLAEPSTFLLLDGLALIAGLLLGVVLAFLLEYLGSNRRPPKEVPQRPDSEPVDMSTENTKDDV